MNKLNMNDFTKMMPPKGLVGGSVAKAMQNQSGSSGDQSLMHDAKLNSGGTSSSVGAQPSPNIDSAVNNNTTTKSSGIGPIAAGVIALSIAAIGVCVWYVVKGDNSDNINHKNKKNEPKL